MNFQAAMKIKAVQEVANEIRLIVSENFEASIAEKRKRRMKAQTSFDRIIDAPLSGIPFEEAAEIVGTTVSGLKELVLKECIPYVNSKGNECITSGIFPRELREMLGTDLAGLGMHSMMVLTGTLQTTECKDIMEIVLEAQKHLLRKIASGC